MMGGARHNAAVGDPLLRRPCWDGDLHYACEPAYISCNRQHTYIYFNHTQQSTNSHF